MATISVDLAQTVLLSRATDSSTNNDLSVSSEFSGIDSNLTGQLAGRRNDDCTNVRV